MQTRKLGRSGPMVSALLAANLRLVDRLAQLAKARGATPAQLALAWVLAAIEAAVPASAVAGARYDEHGKRMLDSERR